ncbi:MAG: GNAT family N-acetyltransferase [Coprococcus sp.]
MIRILEYVELSEKNLDSVICKYIDYYNSCEEGCWTYEKAHKRIHQVMTMEDAMCIVQYDNGEVIGFLMGYYKEFDDLKAYFLEEIVIFSNYHNQGYGTALLMELERIIRNNGAEHIELISVNDEHHMHFYKKLGFYSAGNLTMMGKHFVLK